MDYEKALEFAREKHRGQRRKHGAPYISHPQRVVEILKSKGVEDQEILLGGLFHDLLEDTQASQEDIISQASPRVLELVKLLTKDLDYKMEDYLAGIKEDPDAITIKLADRLANLEDSFNLGPDYKDFLQAYLKNTRDYYIDLAKDTVFQKDLEDVLARLDKFLLELEART